MQTTLLFFQARNLNFTNDWLTLSNDSSNDLALMTRAYYWTAAAVQNVRAGGNAELTMEIKAALTTAAGQLTSQAYTVLIQLFEMIIAGTEQLS